MTPPPRSGGAARAAPAGPRTLAAQGRAHARGGWPHRHGPAQLGAQAQLRAEGLQLRVTPRQTLARPKVQAALRARRASAPCHCARAPRLAAHWLCTEVPKSVAAGRLWQEARTKRARARARRAVLARGAGLAASPRPRRRAGPRPAAAAAAPAKPSARLATHLRRARPSSPRASPAPPQSKERPGCGRGRRTRGADRSWAPRRRCPRRAGPPAQPEHAHGSLSSAASRGETHRAVLADRVPVALPAAVHRKAPHARGARLCHHAAQAVRQSGVLQARWRSLAGQAGVLSSEQQGRGSSEHSAPAGDSAHQRARGRHQQPSAQQSFSASNLLATCMNSRQGQEICVQTCKKSAKVAMQSAEPTL